MTDFTTLLSIGSDFLDVVNEIERYFHITVDKQLIERIFNDSEEDQVTEKKYLIFAGEKRIFKKPLMISATVDEYEPDAIWIEIKNIKEKDLQHLNEFISG
jgi:hypothetical protein